MNKNNLVAASTLAQKNGVKALVYGPPGTGKTPLIKTAPRPVLCVVEPGMLSMRDAHNVPAFAAYDFAKIDEFFKWFFESAEAKAFDTLGLDSLSQMAEIVLTHYKSRNKDGRKAYGEMSEYMMNIINKLYFMPQKHLYLICKQARIDNGDNSYMLPSFPGQDLSVKVPHLFDEIIRLAKCRIPGVVAEVTAFQTRESFNYMARDRSGKLDEFEQPDLSTLFNKCMQ